MTWRTLVVIVVAVIAVTAVALWPRDQPPVREAIATTAQPSGTIGKRVDPKTRPAAALDGVVRDATKRSLARADVCVVYAEDRRCVQSGADGRFEITDVVADDVELTAGLATYQPALVGVPRLAPGERRTIDVTLTSGGVELTGVVEDILGGPIAKASVSVDGAHALTGEDGRFSLWLVATREDFRSLVARASGYGPRTQTVRVPGETVIALAPDSTITGKVVDAATGAPVPQARVIVRPLRIEVTSGVDGTFVFDGLAAGDVEVEAMTATRFGRLERAIPLGVGERVDGLVVHVYPGRSVVATLEVVGDRTVCNPAPTLSDWSFQMPKPWRDEDGRYHFDGLPPSVYAVDVGCGAVIPPLVVGDADQSVTWRVETGGIVKGSIEFAVEQSHRPYVQVTLARAGSKKPPLKIGTTDGTFEFKGIPAGTYRLSASSNSQSAPKAETIVLANGQTIERDLVFETAGLGRITGKAVHAGRPVTFGVVRAVATSADAEPSVVHGKISDGTYEINAPAGRYTLTSPGQRVQGGREGTVNVEAGETVTVALEIERSQDAALPKWMPRSDERHVLSGRVLDANRAPIVGAIVTAVQSGRWFLDDDPSALRVTTGADGRFSFTSRAASRTVDVYRVGGGHARANLEGGVPETITLAPARTISGTVTRASGAPAPRFQLRIGEGRGARIESFDHTGGRFVIADSGEYPIVLAALINGISGPSVPVTADAAKTGIALVLPRTVTITGRIVDGETRKPIENVRINGRRSGDGWAPWFVHADQVTDGDGRFTMRDLPAGAMTLEVTPPTDHWSTQMMSITVPDANAADLGELGLAQVRRR